MESILRARAEAGPFTSLEDFCARVDLRLVNRRVLESLSKAGAFDSLGLSGRICSRPRMPRSRAASASSATAQRARRRSSTSCRPERPPSAAEWPRWYRSGAGPAPRLREGGPRFYVSGHPLARFRGVVESLGLTTTAELAAKGHAARVLLFGHATGAQGDVHQERATAWRFSRSRTWTGRSRSRSSPSPTRRPPRASPRARRLLVRGRVDDGEKGRVVLADDIRPLEEALAENGGRHRVAAGEAERVPDPPGGRHGAGGSARRAPSGLRRASGTHPAVPPPPSRVRRRSWSAAAEWPSTRVQELCAKVESLLGGGTITVEYAGRA